VFVLKSPPKVIQKDIDQISEKILLNLQQIVESHHYNLETLFAEYGKIFDLFNFGIILLKILLINKHNSSKNWPTENVERYFRFVQRLIMYNFSNSDSLHVKSVKEAIDLWNIVLSKNGGSKYHLGKCCFHAE